MQEVYVLHNEEGKYYNIDVDYNINTIFIKESKSIEYATRYEFLDNLYEDLEWLQSCEIDYDIIGNFKPVGYTVVEVLYNPIENRTIDLKRDHL